MIDRILLFCTLTVTLLCGGCAASINGPCSVAERVPAKTVYLVNHGRHVGIVVKRVDIPDDVRLVHQDIAGTGYLEIGWGAREYYQTPNPHLGDALKALLPGPSALHIVAFNDPVTTYFSQNEIIALQLSYSEFQRLVRYIAASYDRDPAGNPILLSAGLYGSSQFYGSQETYHLFKTCNVWVARALYTAGCPVRPFLAITGDNLMFQVQGFGTILRDKPSDN